MKNKICGIIVSSGRTGIKDGHACFNKMPCADHPRKKVDFSKVCWGIGKIGGGNLDVLRQATKVPGICDEHQQAFMEIIECNNCNVRLD